MGKSMKPDYLTLCSIAAQKAGTSYGKYMVMHGYRPPIQADVEDVEAPQGISKICPQCGKEFTQGKINWSARKPTRREPLKGDTTIEKRRLAGDKETGR